MALLQRDSTEISDIFHSEELGEFIDKRNPDGRRALNLYSLVADYKKPKDVLFQSLDVPDDVSNNLYRLVQYMAEGIYRFPEKMARMHIDAIYLAADKYPVPLLEVIEIYMDALSSFSSDINPELMNHTPNLVFKSVRDTLSRITKKTESPKIDPTPIAQRESYTRFCYLRNLGQSLMRLLLGNRHENELSDQPYNQPTD